jgi:hypothetical protein
MCFAQREHDTVAMLVGAYAPIVALSLSSRVNDEFRYVDDAAFGSAVSGYAPHVQLLAANELSSDLTEADVEWLQNLSSEMNYKLRHWRPRTVGDVIFNTWD